MSDKAFTSQQAPSAHGPVKVKVYRYGADEYAEQETAAITHAEIFAEEDLPAEFGPVCWTCPDCGGTNPRRAKACMFYNCPSNMPPANDEHPSSDVEEPEVVGLEETEEAVMSEVMALITLLMSAGHTALSLHHTQNFRDIFDALDRHQNTPPAPGAHRSRGFILEDRHGEVRATVVVPHNTHTCGTLYASYAGLHTDYSVQWSQDEEHHDKVVCLTQERQERERRRRISSTHQEGLDLIARARAIKSAR